VGSNGEEFAIYNIRSNRYLVYRPVPSQFTALGLIHPYPLGLFWKQAGRPPVDVAARADFIPVELFFSEGMWDGRRGQSVYLTIQNIGNVPSSASQQVMKVTIRGKQTDFEILQPVAPGAFLRDAVKFSGLLQHCEKVEVELDTNPNLKFQAEIRESTNNDVFANDRKTLVARDVGRADLPGQLHDCGPQQIERASRFHGRNAGKNRSSSINPQPDGRRRVRLAPDATLRP
jgi:hypothetical protein